MGINTNNPDPSAILDVTASDKGFLPPRIANTGSVAQPAKGLIIYDLSDDELKINVGNATTPVWSDLSFLGSTHFKVVNSQDNVFQNGGFGNNCTPQPEFFNGTYFSLQNYNDGAGNNYCLPNPVTSPGKMMVIRNVGDTSAIFLAVPSGSDSSGICLKDALCTNFYQMPGTGAGKSVMLFSDGANWTLFF